MNGSTQQDIGKLILRIVLGVLVFLHGLTTLEGGLPGITQLVETQGFPGFFAYGVIIGEVIAPLLVIAGFFSRIGGILIVVNMLFALYLVLSGLERFLVEFLRRNDEVWAGLTVPQIESLGLMVVGIAWFALASRRRAMLA